MALLAPVETQDISWPFIRAVRLLARVANSDKDRDSLLLRALSLELDCGTPEDRLVKILGKRESIATCNECRLPTWQWRMRQAEHDTYICRGCVLEYGYDECQYCARYFQHHDLTYVEDVGNICSDDLHRYVWCDQCEIYTNDGHDFHEDEPEEDEDTERCTQRIVCEAPRLKFRFPNNGGLALANDQRETVILPAGLIAEEGISEIANYIMAEMGWTSTGRRYMEIIHGMDRRWQLREGNFTKRFAKAVHELGNGKLPTHVISEIGNIGRRHSTDTSTWHVEFTRDLNRSAEDFYYGGSCWWTSHSISRCMLKQRGGLAIRSYSSNDRNARYRWTDNCTGRAFIMPLDIHLVPTHDTILAHAYVVFNSYGDLDGFLGGRVVAHLADRSYRKIIFQAGETDDIYINNNSGILVADAKTCATTSAIDIGHWSHHYQNG
jgi:hypothetical protein